MPNIYTTAYNVNTNLSEPFPLWRFFRTFAYTCKVKQNNTLSDDMLYSF